MALSCTCFTLFAYFVYSSNMSKHTCIYIYPGMIYKQFFFSTKSTFPDFRNKIQLLVGHTICSWYFLWFYNTLLSFLGFWVGGFPPGLPILCCCLIPISIFIEVKGSNVQSMKRVKIS